MTEPCTHLTTTTAPNGSLAASLAQGISQYAERFEEASVLEIAAAMSVEDPHAARSFLLERTAEPAFPMLRRSVLGTIELRIEAAKAAARDRLLLVTGDDAPGGKSDKAREAIFRRFHSIRPEGEAFGKHSGLGLAIAKAIVEAHHGSITVENRDDAPSGARFVIRLPIAES